MQQHTAVSTKTLSYTGNALLQGLLSQQEQEPVEEFNQAHAPVHIEKAERPVDARSAGSDPLVDVVSSPHSFIP